jgi:1-acyl-sn-glycerol-3-phosphate acyltransferase
MEKLHKFFLRHIGWHFSRYLGYLVNLKVHGAEILSSLGKDKIVFISNHAGTIDPFLIGACIPNEWFKERRCLRYMTYFKYVTRRIYGPLIWLFGAYPVYKGNGNYDDVLKRTYNYLEEGCNLQMFPTGRMEAEFDPKKARVGVAYIAKRINPTFVPVYIDNSYRIGFWELLRRGRQVSITFGQPFKYNEVDNPATDMQKLARKIMERVPVSK